MTRTLVTILFALAWAAESTSTSWAQEVEATPSYRLAVDAVTGLSLAGDSADPRAARNKLSWVSRLELLHRVEAEGWGLVLNHTLDLKYGSISGPASTVYEAYARLDLAEWGQLFAGKRRVPLGIGTAFAPVDALNPRSGFWDQKNGFRGFVLAASVGADLALRAAVSLERNLESPTSTNPDLLAWAGDAELQLGSLQLAASGVWSYAAIARPGIGASFDLGGVILRAETAVELEGDATWFAAGGARTTLSSSDEGLTLAIDGDYRGGYDDASARLLHTWYFLPSIDFSATERFSVFVRALVGIEEPSAVLDAGLALYPARGFGLEARVTAGLGDDDTEFAQRAIMTEASTYARYAFGLSVRADF